MRAYAAQSYRLARLPKNAETNLMNFIHAKQMKGLTIREIAAARDCSVLLVQETILMWLNGGIK